MFLVKCSCGCFFTFRQLDWNSAYRCQNCGKRVPVTSQTNLKDYDAVCAPDGIKLSIIPDYAHIAVTLQT